MSKAAMNLQDSFLNQVRRENTEVKVLLVNGTALRGVVKGFDNFTVILNNRNGQHLIYKHAIAQLVNQRAFHPRRDGEESFPGLDGEGMESEGESVAEPVEAMVSAPAHTDSAPESGRREATQGGVGGHEGGRRESSQGGGDRNRNRRESGGGGERHQQNAPRNQSSAPRNSTNESAPAGNDGNRGGKKEGFNRLDLSSVRLAGEKD